MRRGKRNTSWRESFNQSFALVHYTEAPESCSLQKVDEYWHRTFSCVARHLGFNKATTKILWEELAEGNWDRLHTTEEEQKMTPEEWLERLHCQVFYCSDRWSLDKLMRCHWLYRQYKWALYRAGRVDYDWKPLA